MNVMDGPGTWGQRVYNGFGFFSPFFPCLFWLKYGGFERDNEDQMGR